MTETSRAVLVVVLVVLAVVLLPALWMAVLMGGGMGPWMMGPWMMGGWSGTVSPWWVVLSFIFSLLVLAGIGLLVIWAVRQVGAGTGARVPRALEVLQERYARGEISREQYEQIRRDLEASAP